MKLILLYLLIINATGFLSMLSDKHRARKNAWRIPERTLLAIACFGGSIGSILGMQLLRHKTRHLKFSLGLPLILAVQMAAAAWLLVLMK